jgi:hypothetical protein
MEKNLLVATFLVSNCFDLLKQAANDQADPLRYCSMGTVNLDNDPEQRTVILRSFNERDRTLDIFTDHRSSKLQHLSRNPKASLLFYHAEKLIQIRMQTDVQIHWKDSEARTAWDTIAPARRSDYCSVSPPRTALKEPGADLPAWWTDSVTREQTEYGFERFALLRCRFHLIDLLKLRQKEHRRAVFQWEHEQWKGQWATP